MIIINSNVGSWSRLLSLSTGHFKASNLNDSDYETFQTKYVINSLNYKYFYNQNKEKSKSMVHLLARPPPPPPRQTKSSKLRNQNMTLRNTRSSLSLNTDCKYSPNNK